MSRNSTSSRTWRKPKRRPRRGWPRMTSGSLSGLACCRMLSRAAGSNFSSERSSPRAARLQVIAARDGAVPAPSRVCLSVCAIMLGVWHGWRCVCACRCARVCVHVCMCVCMCYQCVGACAWMDTLQSEIYWTLDLLSFFLSIFEGWDPHESDPQLCHSRLKLSTNCHTQVTYELSTNVS